MTINDYYLVMKDVGIADLKARLSAHLRRVRAGESLTVLDRATPVARIVPYEHDAAPLKIRRPRASAAAPGVLTFPPAPPLDRDVVELLLEDRASGR